MGSVYSGRLMRFYATVILMITSANALYVVVPLYAYSIGASQIEIGLIGAVYWAAQIPLQPIMGRLSSRIGSRVLLLIGILGNGLLVALLPFSHLVWQLLVIRVAQGAFISAFWPATRTFAADEAPPMKVGEVMGLYGVAMSLGSMAGPFFGGYISDNYGFYYGFVMAFLTPIMALFPILMTLRPRGQTKKFEAIEQVKKIEKTGITDLGYESRILLIALMALFIEGLTFGITDSIFPVYLSILKFTKTTIGIMLTTQSLALLIAQWIGGRLSDRASRTLLATIGVILCTSIGGIALIQSFPGLLVIMLMVGTGAGLLYPAGLALISELSSKRKGMSFGLFGSASTAGMAFGSQVGGALAQYFGLTAPYYMAFVVVVSVALILVVLHRRHMSHS